MEFPPAKNVLVVFAECLLAEGTMTAINSRELGTSRRQLCYIHRLPLLLNEDNAPLGRPGDLLVGYR